MASTDRAPTVESLDEGVAHVRGKADASLTLEYGDYDCPYSPASLPDDRGYAAVMQPR
jgi:hypothetical protein